MSREQFMKDILNGKDGPEGGVLSRGTIGAYGAPAIGVGYMYLLINLYIMKFSTDVLLIVFADWSDLCHGLLAPRRTIRVLAYCLDGFWCYWVLFCNDCFYRSAYVPWCRTDSELP